MSSKTLSSWNYQKWISLFLITNLNKNLIKKRSNRRFPKWSRTHSNPFMRKSRILQWTSFVSNRIQSRRLKIYSCVKADRTTLCWEWRWLQMMIQNQGKVLILMREARTKSVTSSKTVSYLKASTATSQSVNSLLNLIWRISSLILKKSITGENIQWNKFLLAIKRIISQTIINYHMIFHWMSLTITNQEFLKIKFVSISMTIISMKMKYKKISWKNLIKRMLDN